MDLLRDFSTGLGIRSHVRGDPLSRYKAGHSDVPLELSPGVGQKAKVDRPQVSQHIYGLLFHV